MTKKSRNFFSKNTQKIETLYLNRLVSGSLDELISWAFMDWTNRIWKLNSSESSLMSWTGTFVQNSILRSSYSRSLDVIVSLYERQETRLIHWQLRRRRNRKRRIMSRRSNQVKNVSWHQLFLSSFSSLCLRLLVDFNIESLKSRSISISRRAYRDVFLERFRLKQLFNRRRN
jgi:hypothetical protein